MIFFVFVWGIDNCSPLSLHGQNLDEFLDFFDLVARLMFSLAKFVPLLNLCASVKQTVYLKPVYLFPTVAWATDVRHNCNLIVLAFWSEQCRYKRWFILCRSLLFSALHHFSLATGLQLMYHFKKLDFTQHEIFFSFNYKVWFDNNIDVLHFRFLAWKS